MNRIEQLEAFLLESPSDPFLHYALTMEFLKLNDKDRVLSGFENLLQQFPDYVGKFLESPGEWTKAEEVYKQGIGVATKVRNMHAKGELMGALNLLMGMDDDDEC